MAPFHRLSKNALPDCLSSPFQVFRWSSGRDVVSRVWWVAEPFVPKNIRVALGLRTIIPRHSLLTEFGYRSELARETRSGFAPLRKLRPATCRAPRRQFHLCALR